MNFCPHCMRPATGETCLHCGKPVHWQAQSQQLPLGTTLIGAEQHIYQTGAVIGQGGFGITYMAMDVSGGERVAIKECFPAQCAVRSTDHVNVEPKSGAGEVLAHAVESFGKEATLLSQFRECRSIVQVRDFFSANNTAYLVMEFLDGETLQQRMKRLGRLRAGELLPQLRQLCADLSVLHSRGLLHRDISPDNIMCMPDGSLKLLDFGCARSMEDGHSMSVLLKHGFAPVEQYQTRGQTAATDLYALCATLYYCVTGAMPPPAVDRLEKDALVPPTRYGADLTSAQEKALLWGLAVQPSGRPKDVDQFATALYGTPDWRRAPIDPVPPPPPPPPHRDDFWQRAMAFLRQHKLPFLIGGGAALVLVIVLGVVSVQALFGFVKTSLSATTPPVSTGTRPDDDRVLLGTPAPEDAPALELSPAPEETLAPEETPEIGLEEEGWLYALNDTGVTLLGYEGEVTQIFSPPDEIGGKNVTGIGEGALAGCAAESVYLPVHLESIAASAFADSAMRDVYVYSEVVVDTSAFDGCEEFRALVVREDTEDLSGWEDALPEDCQVFQADMETGIGPMDTLWVLDDGAIYAITDDGEGVLLSVPAGTEEYTVEEKVMAKTVAWVYEDALKNAAEGVVVHLSSEWGFPYYLVLEYGWDVGEMEQPNFAFNWQVSSLAALQMTMERAEAMGEGDIVPIEPDRDFVRAAALRAQELTEKNDINLRPDGSEWDTIFDEFGIEWNHAYIRKANDLTGDEVAEEVLKAAEEWGPETENGYIEKMGLGAWREDDGEFTICFLGDIPG